MVIFQIATCEALKRATFNSDNENEMMVYRRTVEEVVYVLCWEDVLSDWRLISEVSKAMVFECNCCMSSVVVFSVSAVHKITCRVFGTCITNVLA
jgi:hypothetical protein